MRNYVKVAKEQLQRAALAQALLQTGTRRAVPPRKELMEL